MNLQPKTESGSPPIFDSNAMSVSEIVSALQANVDRFKEVLLARDAKHKAEIGKLQEQFELERLMRLHAEEELKRARENYEALLKKVKESRFCDVNDDSSNNVIAELRNREAELENANNKHLETIEKLSAEIAKLTREKNINADSEPLGNTEGEPQAVLQSNIDVGHSLGASGRVALSSVSTHISETRMVRKAGATPRMGMKGGEESKTTLRKVVATCSSEKARKTLIHTKKCLVKRIPSKSNVREKKNAHQKKKLPKKEKRIHISRCSPRYISKLLNELSKDKRNEVDMMGFASLKHVPNWSVNHQMLIALAKAYNTETHELDTPAITFRVTSEMIGNVLGLPFTGKIFDGPTTDEQKMLVKRYHRVGLKWLRERLIANPYESDEDIHDFRRTFIMLALQGFLCPTNNSVTTSWQVAAIVDVENPQQYNWARFIHNRMVLGIERYKCGGVETIDGCMFALMILYFHNLTYKSLGKYREPESPWIKHWSANAIVRMVEKEITTPTGVLYNGGKRRRTMARDPEKTEDEVFWSAKRVKHTQIENECFKKIFVKHAEREVE